MLKLLPTQVAHYWPLLKGIIEECLPPITIDTPEKMNNILEAILCDRLHTLVFYIREEDKAKIKGYAVVSCVESIDGAHKNMLLYAVWSIGQISEEAWIEAYGLVSKYAKGLGCKALIGFTDVPSLISLVSRFGGNSSYRLVFMEIK